MSQRLQVQHSPDHHLCLHGFLSRDHMDQFHPFPKSYPSQQTLKCDLDLYQFLISKVLVLHHHLYKLLPIIVPLAVSIPQLIIPMPSRLLLSCSSHQKTSCQAFQTKYDDKYRDQLLPNRCACRKHEYIFVYQLLFYIHEFLFPKKHL